MFVINITIQKQALQCVTCSLWAVKSTTWHRYFLEQSAACSLPSGEPAVAPGTFVYFLCHKFLSVTSAPTYPRPCLKAKQKDENLLKLQTFRLFFLTWIRTVLQAPRAHVMSLSTEDVMTPLVLYTAKFSFSWSRIWLLLRIIRCNLFRK